MFGEVEVEVQQLQWEHGSPDSAGINKRGNDYLF